MDVSYFDFCFGRFLEYVVWSKFIITNSQADIFNAVQFLNSKGSLYRHLENRSKFKLVVALNGTYLNQSINFTTNLRCILVTKSRILAYEPWTKLPWNRALSEPATYV